MTLSRQLQSTTSLLDATRAVSNWRALLLAGGTALASALVFGLLAITGLKLLVLVGWLASLVVLFYGFNAVGIMLMDACRMGVAATPGDAIRRSLSSSHRVLGVALTALAGLLALVAVVAVVLFICKIPVLGPVLFTFVLPLSVLLLGVAGLALLYVYLPLAACAVWTGAGVMQAVSQLLTIVRRRLVTVILQELVLTLIVLGASFVIGAVLLMGFSITGRLASGILGPQALVTNPALLMMGLAGGGHMLGAIVGSIVLLALATVVPGLILVQGFCQIYLEASDTLVSDVAGTTVDDTLNTAARLRAAEETAQAQQRERAAADAAQAPATSAPVATPAPTERIEPTVGTAAVVPPTSPDLVTDLVTDLAPPSPASATTPSAPSSSAPSSAAGQQSLGFGEEPSGTPRQDGTPTDSSRRD